ncbi:pilin [Kingella kingae]|uniref:pilin n=1 Tax=Kingella kingae TaxID=504 RepID=UPI00254F9624|nr:pilin [Kingella kingae]MDK4534423.1 pilin [Kingella kingae]MDK4540932.1 pilin [Kingella kingae]MDK4553423.1 pilin [Kingella kingae]
MKTMQKGFTLIELMIVIAIIGILAAIALPAYQDYTKRSRVSEGLSLAGGVKSALTEYYASNNAWPDNNAAAGIAAKEQITGNAVKSVEVAREGNNAAGKGKITVTFNDKVKDNATLIMVGVGNDAGSVKWTCTDGSLDAKFRPSECRNGTTGGTTGG